MEFRWIDWNLEHVSVHGVAPQEAELVVNLARRPYPKEIGDEKLMVWGRGSGGRLLQVIYLLDPDGVAFVIHARPLNQKEKRKFRKRS